MLFAYQTTWVPILFHAAECLKGRLACPSCWNGDGKKEGVVLKNLLRGLLNGIKGLSKPSSCSQWPARCLEGASKGGLEGNSLHHSCIHVFLFLKSVTQRYTGTVAGGYISGLIAIRPILHMHGRLSKLFKILWCNFYWLAILLIYLYHLGSSIFAWCVILQF